MDQVLALYADAVGCPPDQAANQIRNRSGLEGALARPHNFAVYEDADLARQAAVLAHGVTETQPFVDGNKRTALYTMNVFVEINGYRVIASNKIQAAWMIRLSQRGISPTDKIDRLTYELRRLLLPLRRRRLVSRDRRPKHRQA